MIQTQSKSVEAGLISINRVYINQSISNPVSVVMAYVKTETGT